MPRPPTKSGPRKLSDLARLVVAPVGITSTGWPAVRDCCEQKLGITFDDWQHGAGRLILAKRKNGELAAMIDGVGMSLPRQVGKTYLIGALAFALCINNPGLLVIWSAQHARTHGETFLAMQGFAQRTKVKGYVDQIFKGSGDEEIRFHNGSRILFGARERGFGRGIPGVDILVFDEAQILSDRALANMLATMNTSTFGLALFVGTPPRPEDNSEAFERMRNAAIKGELKDGAWIEFGAESGGAEDRKAWARANPSYPRRTPAASMLRLKRKLTEADWFREGLGRWDEDLGASIFGAGNWDAAELEDGERPAPTAIGIEISHDRDVGSIAVVGPWSDDTFLIGALDRRAGIDWLVGEAGRIGREHGIPVAIDSKGPASDLIEALQEEGVDVVELSFEDKINACASMYDAIGDQSATHMGDDELVGAVSGAAKRKVGKRWVWDPLASTSEISMLEAATAAWHARELEAEPSANFL